MNQNSVVSIKSNKLLDISLDSGDEVSAGVKQIVSQFSLDRSINASSNPITIAEYTFIRAAIVFLLSSSDEDLNKKLNWGKTILTLMFDYITAGCFPGMYFKNIKEIIETGKAPIKTYLLDKVKCLCPRLECEYDQYLEFIPSEERKICEAADAYAELFMNKGSENDQLIYGKLFGFMHYKGIQNLICKQDNFSLLGLIAKLNLITRWSHKVCLKNISVSAHSIGVAFITILLIYANGKENEFNIQDIFFSALFHDIREISIGDIVSPVKKELKSVFKDWKKYEKDLFIVELKELVNSNGGKRLVDLVENIQETSSENQIHTTKGLIKFADQLCAFYEGILFVAKDNNNPYCFDRADPVLKNYLNEHSVCGIDITQIISDIRGSGWLIET